MNAEFSPYHEQSPQQRKYDRVWDENAQWLTRDYHMIVPYRGEYSPYGSEPVLEYGILLSPESGRALFDIEDDATVESTWATMETPSRYDEQSSQVRSPVSIDTIVRLPDENGRAIGMRQSMVIQRHEDTSTAIVEYEAYKNTEVYEIMPDGARRAIEALPNTGDELSEVVGLGRENMTQADLERMQYCFDVNRSA